MVINMSIQRGVSLVTSSAPNIGRGTALRLSRDGFDIAFNNVATKHKHITVAVVAEIESLERKTHIVPTDVSEEDQVKKMVNSAVEHLAGLDVMVANAGVVQLRFHRALTTCSHRLIQRVMISGTGPCESMARGLLCYRHAAT
ncbi:hypothetical protein DFH29DRAFT_405003 [Suillus ampliporus]|nr:hypothetical protein DFH29DRAFT_405003 [Suillus ampliporus]